MHDLVEVSLKWSAHLSQVSINGSEAEGEQESQDGGQERQTGYGVLIG